MMGLWHLNQLIIVTVSHTRSLLTNGFLHMVKTLFHCQAKGFLSVNEVIQPEASLDGPQYTQQGTGSKE